MIILPSPGTRRTRATELLRRPVPRYCTCAKAVFLLLIIREAHMLQDFVLHADVPVQRKRLVF